MQLPPGLPSDPAKLQAYMRAQQGLGAALGRLFAVAEQYPQLKTSDAFNMLMKQVTDAVFFLPGVNRSTVQSFYTPNVRFTEVVEDGISGGNIATASENGYTCEWGPNGFLDNEPATLDLVREIGIEAQ